MMDGKTRTRFRRSAAAIVFSSLILHPSSFLHAVASQEEVLRSINESVGGEVDGTKLLAGFAAIVGVIILIAIMNAARNRKVTPRVLNSPGKLLKEVAKGTNLKPAEIKQLKVLCEDQDLSSPLVLLLCPSVLGKALKIKADKIDKRVVAGLVKKVMPNAVANSSARPKQSVVAAASPAARR